MPITALISAASVEVISVSRIAAVAPGTASAVRRPSSPSPKPFVTTAAITGSATIAPEVDESNAAQRESPQPCS